MPTNQESARTKTNRASPHLFVRCCHRLVHVVPQAVHLLPRRVELAAGLGQVPAPTGQLLLPNLQRRTRLVQLLLARG